MTVETTPASVPMSWDQYEAVDSDLRSEYYGGRLVVSAAPSQPHQDIVLELAVRLRAARRLGERVTIGWGWSPEGVLEELVPDVVVHTSLETRRLTSVPLLVVEVLSSHRSTDVVDKMQRYARWGAPTYWTVDPRDHEIVVHDLRDGLYTVTAVHTDGVVVASYAGHDVEIDVDTLFGTAS